MLKHLSIRNIAIIESVDLDFSDGLTVITGESGSGKSILLDSMALAFGQKVSPKEVLQAGQSRGQVELLFSLAHRRQDETFRQILSLEGIELEDGEDELLLTREFTSGGSRSRINGTPVNRDTLEALRPWIVDLHGQHELTSLFRLERQLAYLDAYGGSHTLDLRRAVYEAYFAWQKLRQQLDERNRSQKEKLQQRDFLAFQLEELEKAELTDGNEDENLRAELKLLSFSEKRLSLIEKADTLLSSGDSDSESYSVSLLDQLANLEKFLAEAVGYDENLSDLLKQVEGAHAELKSVSSDLGRYHDHIEINPERIAELTDRLDLLEKLKRKHGSTLEQVIATRDQIAEELAGLETAEEDSRRLEQELVSRESLLRELCEQLHSIRTVLAEQLKKDILSQLQDLAMPNLGFDVAFQSVAYSPDGMDEITFLCSTNPGEPLRPLAKIASGGELSRFLLAMKVLTAKQDGLLTLVFDEIDSGVSGPTAKALAEKLARLSVQMQVIAITHQPVVAAMGRQHVHVEKRALLDRDGVQVTIQHLEVDEIARVGVLSRLASGLSHPDAAVESFIKRLRDEATHFYGQLTR